METWELDEIIADISSLWKEKNLPDDGRDMGAGLPIKQPHTRVILVRLVKPSQGHTFLSYFRKVISIRKKTILMQQYHTMKRYNHMGKLIGLKKLIF